MFTEHFFERGPIGLNYASGPPSGPPLLFLHGVTRRWQDFLILAPMLAVALACSRAGLPRARPLVAHSGRLSSDRLRQRCGGIFDSAHFREPAVVYGHSLGALTAVALAGQTPELVRGLVLEEPPAFSLIPHIRSTPFHAMFAGMQRLAGDSRSVREITRQLADVRIPIAGVEGGARLGDLRDPTNLRFLARCLQDMDPEVFAPLLEGRLLQGCDIDALAGA